jgi:DNA-directed RNA polymerase specialized sigma24 family protein
MFVDELSTRDALVRMVRRMTGNTALREDLLQEALIHLWLTEARRPGQTKSWYLQSCKYHLLHYLASGRSVDSAKRRGGQLEQSPHDMDDRDGFQEEIDCGNSVINHVSARDIMGLLSPQLQPNENAVLECFADGLGPREIGRKLSISHTMVIKHRRKIASLLSRLDLPAYERAVTTNGHDLPRPTRRSHHRDGVRPLFTSTRLLDGLLGDRTNGLAGKNGANGHSRLTRRAEPVTLEK